MRLACLPVAHGRASLPGLGYRGMIVRGSKGGRDYRVFGGLVRSGTDEESELTLDPDRELEAWLLRTGRGSLNDSIYSFVKKEVARSGR